MNICPICFRTDALTPGKIRHDQKWHETWAKYLKLKTGSGTRDAVAKKARFVRMNCPTFATLNNL